MCLTNVGSHSDEVSRIRDSKRAVILFRILVKVLLLKQVPDHLGAVKVRALKAAWTQGTL
jgi:hypothetical protein